MSEILNLIQNYGLPIIAVVFLWKKISNTDEENKKWTQDQISYLKTEIKENRESYMKSVDAFNETIKDFKAIRADIKEIKEKL